MSDLRDKILHSREAWVEGSNCNERFVMRLLKMVRSELTETGDRDWFFDCLEQSSIRISHIEPMARRVASGLTRLGVSPGHIVHTAYNSQLDFYWPVLGAWMCGAGASVADPGLSVDVVRAQLEDTRARVVVVSAQAASTFLAANQLLPEEDRVRHILIIDRDPWQPMPDGCQSFRSLYQDDGTSCPKSLPAYDPLEVAVIHWTSGTTVC